MTTCEFENIMIPLCSRETSSRPEAWSPINPTYGHCAVVAVIAQELFGGDIARVSLEGTSFSDMSSHYLNVIGGKEVDFTLAQFGGGVPYQSVPRSVRTADEVLAHPGTRHRYELLKGRIDELRHRQVGRQPWKKFLRLAVVPLAVLALFSLIGLAWKILDLPSEGEMVSVIRSYFDTYGILLVFVSSIIESAFIVGVYAPGGLVIFLGVILSGGDPLRALMTVASVVFGFLIGFSFDFYIGRIGWYRFLLHFGFGKVLETTKVRIGKYGLSVPWLGYHNPDTGSVVATAYGILGLSYRDFLKKSIGPIIAWCVFWGFIAYFLGMSALQIMGYKALAVIVGVWIVARIIESVIEEKKKRLDLG